MSRSTSSPQRDQLDPVLLHTRREAVVILAALAACLVWSVGWCYLAGYQGPAEAELSTVLGMPSWVFWGVLVPWLAADAFSVWFCFSLVADDPLGECDDAWGEPDDPWGESDDEPGAADGATQRRPPGEEGPHD